MILQQKRYWSLHMNHIMIYWKTLFILYLIDLFTPYSQYKKLYLCQSSRGQKEGIFPTRTIVYTQTFEAAICSIKFTRLWSQAKELLPLALSHNWSLILDPLLRSCSSLKKRTKIHLIACSTNTIYSTYCDHLLAAESGIVTEAYLHLHLGPESAGT